MICQKKIKKMKKNKHTEIQSGFTYVYRYAKKNYFYFALNNFLKTLKVQVFS